MQIVESDKTPLVECSSSIGEMEMPKLDELCSLNGSANKELGDCQTLISRNRILLQPSFSEV